MARLRRLSVLGLTAAAILALALAGCGGSDSAGSNARTSAGSNQAKEVHLLFSGPYGNGYTAATIKGIEDYAAKNNVQVTERDSTLDPTRQFSQIQDAVASQQFGAMVVIPLDGVGLVPAVKQALDKKIAVSTTDFALGPDINVAEPKIQVPGQAGTVYDPYVVRGQQMAKAWIAACQGVDPCKGAFLTGIAALPWEKVVLQTLKQGIRDHPNIQFTAFQQVGSYATADATPIARNVLEAHPDLTVLSAVTDPIAHGWELAARAAGVAGKVKILGIGASTYGVTAVREGRWFSTVLALPYDEGRLAAEIAVKAVRAGGTPAGTAVSAAARSGLPLLLTRATLPADFKGQWEA